MNIFKRIFFSRTARTVSVSFQSNSLLRFAGSHQLGDHVILHVPAGQAAILVSEDVPEKMLTYGDHPLNQQYLEANQVDVLYFNIMYPARRRWRSHYQPSDRPRQRPFEGIFSAQITNVMKFCNALIVKASCGFPAPEQKNIAAQLGDDFVDQWIGVTIDDILRAEKVSTDEMEGKSQVLQEFLHNILKKEFEGYGLKIQDLSIGIEAPKKAPENVPAEQPTEPVVKKIIPPKNIQATPAPMTDPIIIPVVSATTAAAAATPPPVIELEPTSSAVEMEEKVFYRVRSGEQLGPFSAMEIQAFVDQGDVPPRELLWKKGMTSWKTAESFGIFTWN